MNINHAKRMLAHLENQMPNELQPLSNVPAHVLARRAQRPLAETAQVGGAGAMPNRVSTRGNRFTMISAEGETLELPQLHFDCIIVGHNPHLSRMYYGKPFDPDAIDPPDCWSDNGLAPSTDAPDPQSQTCAVCEKSKWGSATSKLTGKGIPACQSSRKLAVFFGDTVYQLRVTPGSFKNWNSYIAYLAPKGAQNPLSYEDVITRVSFQSGVTGVLKFEPTPGGSPYVPQEAYDMEERVKEEQVYRDVLGLDDKPIGEAPQPVKNSMMQVAPTVYPEFRPNTTLPKLEPEFLTMPHRPMEVRDPEPPVVTEPPKRRAKKVEAPDPPSPAPQSMADKVAEAFNFDFKR